MFQPVGPQPPAGYWRRRLVLLGSIGLLIILLTLTVKIAASDGSKPTGAGGGPTTPAVTTPHSSTSHVHPTSPASSPQTHTSASSTKSSSAAAAPCEAKNLGVAAVSTQPAYHVGDQPVLELQVTNNGTQPCVQDLADKQVE